MSSFASDTIGQFSDILDELYHSFAINEKDLHHEMVKDPKELLEPQESKKVMYVGAFNAAKKRSSVPASS